MEDHGESIAQQWRRLESHFRDHAAQVKRFGRTPPDEVIRMVSSGTNEVGARLSSFEQLALTERYCELFGEWPSWPAAVKGV
jgi:hypothetical protein